jgi:hypothetical protein
MELQRLLELAWAGIVPANDDEPGTRYVVCVYGSLIATSDTVFLLSDT